MHGEELILFLGVAALSLAIVVSVVAPILRQRRAPPIPPHPVAPRAPVAASLRDRAALLTQSPACAACLGRWPRGFRYCPLDGSRLDDDGDDPEGRLPNPRSPGRSSGN
jgi:hypothetical protein